MCRGARLAAWRLTGPVRPGVPGDDGTTRAPSQGGRRGHRHDSGVEERGRMEYRRFGQTDLRVSAIGFGCWEMGGTYGKIDEAQFERAVQRAIDAGINCFDTAEAYGLGASERALARALGGRRQEIAIVTKFGTAYAEA